MSVLSQIDISIQKETVKNLKKPKEKNPSTTNMNNNFMKYGNSSALGKKSAPKSNEKRSKSSYSR